MSEFAGVLKLARRQVPRDTAALDASGPTGRVTLDAEGRDRLDRLEARLIWHQHFEHLSPDDLRRTLLEAIAAYQTSFRQGERPDSKQVAATFMDQWAREPAHARVFLSVQHLTLTSALDVGIARFVPVAHDDHLKQSAGGKVFEQYSLSCQVDATGGTESKIVERAMQQAVRALSLLRLHLRQAYRGLHDDQLLFQLSGAYIIELDDGTQRRGYHSHRGPIALDLPHLQPELVSSLENEGRAIQALPVLLRERVETALEWMDVAARALTWKTQIPAIFSGMESLLVPEDCGHKAEVLTVRSVVLQAALGEAFFHPAQTYSAYLVRCHLVHGTPLVMDLTGELERCAHDCAWWGIDIISAYVTYASRTRIIDASKLVRTLDRSDAAEQAWRWFSEGGYDGIVSDYRAAVGLLAG